MEPRISAYAVESGVGEIGEFARPGPWGLTKQTGFPRPVALQIRERARLIEEIPPLPERPPKEAVERAKAEEEMRRGIIGRLVAEALNLRAIRPEVARRTVEEVTFQTPSYREGIKIHRLYIPEDAVGPLVAMVGSRRQIAKLASVEYL